MKIHIGRYLLWLFLLLMLVAGIYAVSSAYHPGMMNGTGVDVSSVFYRGGASGTEPMQAQGPRAVPKQPAATEADTVSAQDLVPFSVLISYTDNGFEPSDITIRNGDTVRFTNNSTSNAWFAGAVVGDAGIYPRLENGCGSSALDTCDEVGPGHFWQFTFESSGQWGVRDNLDKSKTLVVHVK